MVRPLTKRSSEGVPYIRPPQVEAQINEVFSQSPATLRRRLTIADTRSPEYLCSECLVHLIRDARRNGDEPRTNAVISVLLSRCEANLLSSIPDNKLPTAADVREEVLGQFSELFATDGTEENRDDLDHFECRFNQAFSTFRIDLVRSEIARLKRFEPLPDQVDDIEFPHKEIPTRLIEALRSQETAESAVLLREIYEAIDTLPGDEWAAVTLCHVMDYKIESNNPRESTAATICNVSGRTIRNRLSRAAEKLSAFKEAGP